MGQILLTPEEVKGNYLTYYTKRFNSETEAQDFVENLNIGAGKFMAKAQLRKVIDWLHEDIRREITKDGEVVVFRKWGEDWQNILKEVEEIKEISDDNMA